MSLVKYLHAAPMCPAYNVATATSAAHHYTCCNMPPPLHTLPAGRDAQLLELAATVQGVASDIGRHIERLLRHVPPGTQPLTLVAMHQHAPLLAAGCEQLEGAVAALVSSGAALRRQLAAAGQSTTGRAAVAGQQQGTPTRPKAQPRTASNAQGQAGGGPTASMAESKAAAGTGSAASGVVGSAPVVRGAAAVRAAAAPSPAAPAPELVMPPSDDHLKPLKRRYQVD